MSLVRSTPSSSTDAHPQSAAAGRVAPGSVAPPAPWLRIEVNQEALRHNMALFRERIEKPARLLAVVKAGGYGHGILIAAQAFLAGGADMLGVHSLSEAAALRDGGIAAPILILGPVDSEEVLGATRLGDVELTVSSLTGCRAVAAAAKQGADCSVHLKVETGVYRQGLLESELDAAVAELGVAANVKLVGLSSHFADIEDTTDHSFAQRQRELFERFSAALAARGHGRLCRHMSCSASAILWKSSHHDLVRVGISGYGIWPSRETLISARQVGRNQLALRPALTWKCRIAQIKELPAGHTVGYGRTWKAPLDSRIAVLPVGYSDGYPRALSNRAYVLIRGQRAPVRGRICMNLCMVDVTHIPGAEAGDEAVLLGRQDQEEITAELLAELLGTIPYEVVVLPGETWQRVAV
jgi:alanine racemase